MRKWCHVGGAVARCVLWGCWKKLAVVMNASAHSVVGYHIRFTRERSWVRTPVRVVNFSALSCAMCVGRWSRNFNACTDGHTNAQGEREQWKCVRSGLAAVAAAAAKQWPAQGLG